MIKIPDGLIIGSTNFDLDIDKDNTIDLSILIVKDYSSMHSWANYVQISPKNGYELCYSNYVDTSWYWNPTLPAKVFQYGKSIMPKIFNVGDTIKIEGNFTNNPTMISYYYHSSGLNSEYNSDIIWRAWYNIGYKYIVLRQRKETVNKLA
jgi:hypothetical protein